MRYGLASTGCHRYPETDDSFVQLVRSPTKQTEAVP